MQSEPITLVLLPGIDGSGELFAPFVEALGPQVPVVVVRYPGERALGFVLENEGMIDKTLLFDIELIRVDDK